MGGMMISPGSTSAQPRPLVAALQRWKKMLCHGQLSLFRVLGHLFCQLLFDQLAQLARIDATLFGFGQYLLQADADQFDTLIPAAICCPGGNGQTRAANGGQNALVLQAMIGPGNCVGVDRQLASQLAHGRHQFVLFEHAAGDGELDLSDHLIVDGQRYRRIRFGRTWDRLCTRVIVQCTPAIVNRYFREISPAGGRRGIFLFSQRVLGGKMDGRINNVRNTSTRRQLAGCREGSLLPADARGLL